MFERLTKELWDGCPIEEFSHFVELDSAEAKIIGEGWAHPVVAGKSIDRLAAYEDSGLSPEEVQELAKAKEEGRLVVLPHKEGIKLFKIEKRAPCEQAKQSLGVAECLYPTSGSCIECKFYYGTPHITEFQSTLKSRIEDEISRYKEAFGKTVFITRGEAEKAIGGGEG